MNLVKSALLFLFIIAACGANAQLQQPYLFEKDDSLLKKKYFEQASQKQNALLASLDKKYKDEYKKIYVKRFEQISELYKSSRVVTEPEAHDYLQAILKKIIDVNPELKALDIRLTFSRDWWPNAYSMGEGTLIINAGLMVYLHNEAELAFVICHELSHYYFDHSGQAIKKYIDATNNEDLQKELKRLSKEEFRVNEQLSKLSQSLIFDSRKHSRSNEAEADMQALQFMKKTGFDCQAIITTLRMFDKVDELSFFKPLDIEAVFNFKEYPFKKKWTQKESSIFGQLDESESSVGPNEKDSLKTHPDCTKRIALVRDSINSAGKSKNLFIVNENSFNQLKKDFINEITEECFKENNLSRNLYYSLQLLEQKENTSLAIFSVARCLNMIYEKQQEHKLGLTIDAENKNYSKDYNLLLRMLSRLRLDEIAAINYNFCKQYKEEMKNYSGFAEEIKKANRFNN